MDADRFRKDVDTIRASYAERIADAERSRDKALAQLAQAFADGTRLPVPQSKTRRRLRILPQDESAETPAQSLNGDGATTSVDDRMRAALDGLDGEFTIAALSDRLAEEAFMPRSTIRGSLKRLEIAGELEISDPGGRGRTNPTKYRKSGKAM